MEAWHGTQGTAHGTGVRKMIDREQASRLCYCAEGETTCGTCEVCGAPGHTRHYPGARPYTGSWCDACYRRVAGDTPGVKVLAWIVVAVAFLLPLWLAWRR